MYSNLKFIIPATVACGGVIGLGASLQSVEQGHVGYLNYFGDVRGKEYEPGLHMVNPFSRMIGLNLKKQLSHNSMDITSIEGLSVSVSVDTIYTIDPVKARKLYINVGPRFCDIMLNPQLKSITRDTVAGYEAKALYTEETRTNIRRKIFDDLKDKTGEVGIRIEDVLINKITLPDKLRHSIEEKLQSEQEMQRMEFIVQKEEMEANRKAIEAKGIKTFQEIVSEGISPELLKWKGIEATKDLAKSNNTKVIVIGSGKDGMPLILNSD